MIKSTFKLNSDPVIMKYVSRQELTLWYMQTFPGVNFTIVSLCDMVFHLRTVYAPDLSYCNVVKFFGSQDYCSNWYPCVLHLDGHVFYTVEQYMMWRKAKLFKDEEIADKILATYSPRECKALGRQVRNFNTQVWNVESWSVVKKACACKFSEENPELYEWFMSLDKPMFVECSPYDSIWGIKLPADSPHVYNMQAWKGTNRLGRILTEVWYENKEKKESVLK